MQRIVDGYFHVLKIAIVACLAGMVIMVFGNVVLRYAFNMGLTISEELSRFLFVWLTFLGAIMGFHERGHLGVDMLVSRLSPTGKKGCLIISELLMLWVTWLFLVGSWEQTMINLDVKISLRRALDGVDLRRWCRVQCFRGHHSDSRPVPGLHRPDVGGRDGHGKGIGRAGRARGVAAGAGGAGCRRRAQPRAGRGDP